MRDSAFDPRGKIIINTGIDSSNLIPFFSFWLLLILMIVLVRFGVTKLAEQKKTIQNLKTREQALLERKNILEQASKGIIPLYATPSSVFLPTDSTVLVSLYNVRNLLSGYLLPLEEFSISVANKGLLEESIVLGDRISLKIVGGFQQIDSFLKRVESVVPLMNVSKFSLASEGAGDDLFSCEVELISFWSPFSISKTDSNARLQDFTEKEKEVLDNLSKMEKTTLPEEQLLSPEGGYERTSPFLE